jgi:uncharacterized protein
MADSNVAIDPWMDEILEKIQRTIATEGLVEQQAPASPRPSADVPATQMSDENEIAGRHAQGATPEPGDRLLSPATAGMAVTAFAQLAAIRRQQQRAREFPLGGEQRTIEDVVRELLQPMMRDWMAEKLGPIVERLVRAELARALDESQGP